MIPLRLTAVAANPNMADLCDRQLLRKMEIANEELIFFGPRQLMS